MTRIVLNVLDEQKAEPLMILLRDLSYIAVQDDYDNGLKTWDGSLKVLDNPITVNDFRVYSREELHER
ncbi:hypothetical protein FACS1894216_03760 [Synergistales bacterium]|nr:hypothetical protein FACS1894216_03760 [Synergistales bacterium]